MSLIRCLLEYADSQFAQETGEALATARTLYLAAIDLLNLPVLQQKLGTCDALMAEPRDRAGQGCAARGTCCRHRHGGGPDTLAASGDLTTLRSSSM